MKQFKLVFVALFFVVSLGFLPVALLGQVYHYQVGSGSTSLEPGSNIISLSLAGYGGPRDGRFTLRWEKIGDSMLQVADMTFTKDKLFIITNGEVRKYDKNGKLEVSSIGNLEGLSLLTSDEKQLYGLRNDKEVFVAKLKNKMRWKSAGFKLPVDDPVAIVKDGKKFIIADRAGVVWEALPAGRDYKLQQRAVRPGIIALLVHAGRLYALTDTELLYLEPDGNWLRKAIRNDKNLPEEIKLIGADQGIVFGFDGHGSFYKAGQHTDGNLTASAVSIKKGAERVLIVSLDVCGLDGDFVNLLKEELAATYKLPKQAVLINSSHTHFAPVTQRWTTWGEHCQRPDSLYLRTTVKQGILDVAKAAIKSEKEANLYFGRDTVQIGRNRNLRGDNLPYDDAVDVVQIAYKNQEASDVLFLAGCHPVFTSNEMDFYKLSANYPGEAREQLVHHSQVRRPIFLQGCGGDINPVDLDYKVTGRRLANAVKGILDGDKLQEIHGDINYGIDTINFPTRPWPKEDLLALKAEKEKLVGDLYAESRVRWANLMLSYYETGTMPRVMPVYIQTLNIGNWKLLGISRETTTEYSLAVKQLWPGKMVSVAGYSNDVSSYLPTSRHIKARIYEGEDSFFWYGQPNVFPENVHEVIIEAIRKKNR